MTTRTTIPPDRDDLHGMPDAPSGAESSPTHMVARDRDFRMATTCSASAHAASRGMSRETGGHDVQGASALSRFKIIEP